MPEMLSNTTQKPAITTTKARRNREKQKARKRKKLLKKQQAKASNPIRQYISVCCSLPARKPRCGQEETLTDPESGKAKDTQRGLGHWRCSACNQRCKVTVRIPVNENTESTPTAA